ncbi:MAG: hypothetical protein ACFB16_23745, partial [Phormidesmis sp.]
QLKAIAYSNTGGKGQVVATETLNYTITDSTGTPTPTPPAPEPPAAEEPITFALVTADTDKVVKGFEDLSDSGTIDLSGLDLEKYNLVAQVKDGSAVKSVKFESGLGDRIENVEPYALFGDIEGDFMGKSPRPGSYSVKASAYTKSGGKGEAIATSTTEFTVAAPSAAATKPMAAIAQQNTSSLADLGMVSSLDMIEPAAEEAQAMPMNNSSGQPMQAVAGDTTLIGAGLGVELGAQQLDSGESGLFAGEEETLFALGNADGISYDGDYSLGAFSQGDTQSKVKPFSAASSDRELMGVAKNGEELVLESTAASFV